MGGLLAGTLLGPEVTEHAVMPFLVVIFVSFSAGAHARRAPLRARRWRSASRSRSASVIADPQQNADLASLLFTPTFTVGAPMLFGQLLRNRQRLNQALQDRARRDERGRAAEAEAAAQEERTRIAGELHDVVAHALSAMTVQASAARRLAAQDPARATVAFAAVEGTGREALTELRRLLGVLRKEDEELALDAAAEPRQPRRPRAPHDRVGPAGRRSRSRAPRSPLPAGVDLTAYRVVQEALGGARDGGFAGRAEVAIGYGGRPRRARRPRRRQRRGAGGCSARASASRSTAAS